MPRSREKRAETGENPTHEERYLSIITKRRFMAAALLCYLYLYLYL